MQDAINFYRNKPFEFLAKAYATQIYSDIWEKISEGFECKTIKEFYEECSAEELLEITTWNNSVFGKELCDSVDYAIDYTLIEEHTEISNVAEIEIDLFHFGDLKFWVSFRLIDPEHKRAKLIDSMKRNGFYTLRQKTSPRY